MPSIIATEISENRKTGPVSATYASFDSCPTTCQFLNNGCYAQNGPISFHTKRLKGRTPETIARAEARGIDGLTGERPIRIHVSGDCRTDEAARIVSGAAERYKDRHGQPAYTYTHAWRSVDRKSWGGVSVLASVESLGAAQEAMNKGYAAAIVVGLHPKDGKAYVESGVRVVPCPAQTRGKTCVECRLCFSDQALLARRSAISFEAHGSGAKRVRKVIELDGSDEYPQPRQATDVSGGGGAGAGRSREGARLCDRKRVGVRIRGR